MITVLTPTYNRAHLLPRLADSLLAQSDKDFEWLVIDDGSTDKTDQIISTYGSKALFPVRYFFKENGGKHSALNVGFNNSMRTWILIVDSDDWLAANCIERIKEIIFNLEDDVGSISFLKAFEDGEVIGDEFPNSLETYFDRIEEGVCGDKADVIKKIALDSFRFPVFRGEKFLAESPMFIHVGQRYRTKFINYPGYICEYQKGGLSESSVLNRHRCFNSSLFVYGEQYEHLRSRVLKYKAAANWWRFRLGKLNLIVRRNVSWVGFPLGFVLFLGDFFKLGHRVLSFNQKSSGS